jgi:hypothetical protein
MVCTVNRNWFLGGYKAEFNSSVPLTADLVPNTVDQLLRALQQILSTRSPSLETYNLKGRDAGDTILSDLPAPHTDELLAIGGTIATRPSNTGFEWSPFHYSIHSKFLRFEGPSTIVFSWHHSCSESIPSWLPWWLLGAAAPIRIEYCRVALELFTNRFSIARLGVAPVVSESLLVDINDRVCAVRLTSEQPRWVACNPFETSSAFKQLAAAIERATQLPLAQLFANELAASGRFQD